MIKDGCQWPFMKGGKSLFESMKIRWFTLMGIIFTLIVIIGASLLWGPEFLEDDIVLDLIVSYTILGIFPLVWFYRQFGKQGKTFADVMSFEKVGSYLSDIFFITLALILFSVGTFWLLGYILSFLLPQYVEWLLAIEDDMPRHILPWLMSAVYLSFIGPVVEELIFRGLLLKRLGKKVNMTFSIIVTNILFGILHMDLFGAFVFGFIASLLYLHSGNLLVPILVHIFNNLFVTVLMAINPPMPHFLTYETISALRSYAIPHVLILAITIPVLFVYIRKYIPALTSKNR